MNKQEKCDHSNMNDRDANAAKNIEKLVDRADFLRIKQKEDSMFPTEFIDVTEMWQDGNYNEVGDLIKNERWSSSRVAEFCAYLNKYLGTRELDVFYKFL
jgi:hypothetical protein